MMPDALLISAYHQHTRDVLAEASSTIKQSKYSAEFSMSKLFVKFYFAKVLCSMRSRHSKIFILTASDGQKSGVSLCTLKYRVKVLYAIVVPYKP